MAELHAQLKNDCRVVGRFPLCHVLLMRDANYPWCILVPDRPGTSEIYQLSQEDQAQLWRESSYLARSLAEAFAADKINIAALGNIVPQLHIHHIVRYRGDAAWPAPVWGRAAPKPYSDEQLHAIVERIGTALGRDPSFGFSPAG